MTTKRFLAGWSRVSILCGTLAAIALSAPVEEESWYRILGVSGTLQDGFPLRPRLDWRDPHNSTHIIAPALFLGTGLVRGYKAYLDIKDESSREYISRFGAAGEENPPQIPNAVVLPTGCGNDANLYHIFAVPEPVLLQVLMHEPRFLSISSDTGLVELDDSLTSEQMRRLVRMEQERIGFPSQGSGRKDCLNDPVRGYQASIAIALVTGVYFNAASYIESPPIEVREDGTRLYSYDGGLLRWMGESVSSLSENSSLMNWTDLYSKVRQAEDALAQRMLEAPAPWTLEYCEGNRLSLGSQSNTFRLNYPVKREVVEKALRDFA